VTTQPEGRPAARPQALLFTPGARLGWTFRDRRSLVAPYPEPSPDPEEIRAQAQARLGGAQRSWQRARKWVARPSLIGAIALIALAWCAHAVSPAAPYGTAFLIALVLAGPGLGWSAWRYVHLVQARAADPEQQYQAMHEQWAQRAAGYERAELARLEQVPEWGSAPSPARRTDIFGGSLAGWRSLLTVHGASIMAAQPLLVADLSGQDAARELAALTREAGVQIAEYLLPRDLDRCGLLAGLSARQLADALAEAIHAGPPGQARTDRAVDVRVLEQLATAIAPGGATLARLTAAVQAALGRDYPAGLLTTREADMIRGPLFGQDHKTHIAANLIRLDAFLAPLASYTGTGPPAAPPLSWCTILADEPAARSARSELVSALVIQWLTAQVTISTRHRPAVIIAAADEITSHHLERIADACDRQGIPLTLMFRHLRDDAVTMIGGGATAFMRLGNHREAEQAASFIGRNHKFVLSGWTATFGGDHSTTRGTSQTWGDSESRGSSRTRGWTEDHLLSRSSSGSHTRSREYGHSFSHGTEQSGSDGQNWSDASSTARVYGYAVEPAVLQNLPDNALLLTARTAGTSLQAVEFHPAIITLPHVSTTPRTPQRRDTGPAPARSRQAPQNGPRSPRGNTSRDGRRNHPRLRRHGRHRSGAAMVGTPSACPVGGAGDRSAVDLQVRYKKSPASVRYIRFRVGCAGRIGVAKGPKMPAGLTRWGREKAGYQARRYFQRRDADITAIGLHWGSGRIGQRYRRVAVIACRGTYRLDPGGQGSFQRRVPGVAECLG